MPRAVFASKSCRIQPSHGICSKALTRASEYFPEDINHQKVNIFYIAQGGKPRQTREKGTVFCRFAQRSQECKPCCTYWLQSMLATRVFLYMYSLFLYWTQQFLSHPLCIYLKKMNSAQLPLGLYFAAVPPFLLPAHNWLGKVDAGQAVK